MKFGAMSQMFERQISGKEVCVVCRTGLVQIHRISQDGPPLSDAHFFYVPWSEVTPEQEKIVKNMITRAVCGLNRHSLVEEILECPKHGDAFKTGYCAAPWCSNGRKLFAKHSKQKPRSTMLIKLKASRKISDEINNHTEGLAAVMQAVNSEHFPSQTTNVWNIAEMSITTGFHMAVGPASDTSLPSFMGECPAVSHLPTPLTC